MILLKWTDLMWSNQFAIKLHVRFVTAELNLYFVH